MRVAVSLLLPKAHYNELFEDLKKFKKIDCVCHRSRI